MLAEPSLIAERDTLRAGSSAWQRQYDAILREPALARNVIEDLERTRAGSSAEQRIVQWTVRSKAAGRLVLPRGEDLPGSFVEKSTTLGYVLDDEPALVRVAVPEEHAALLRGHARRVEVRLSEEQQRCPRALRARFRPRPGCCRARRSASLRVEAMPSIPRTRTASGRSIRYSSSASPWSARRWGAWAAAPVALRPGAEPLAMQWQRRARQALLKHFNPTS